MIEIDRSTLRDHQMRYRTRSLFYETQDVDTFEPIFTLKPYDYNGCVSLKRIYLELALPDNEYEFATTVFGDWEHWKKLCASKWFQAYVSDWREELEIKIKSAAMKAMFDTARYEGSKGTAAAKWIAEGKWRSQRGRPSKDEVERERRIQAGVAEEVDEHYALMESFNAKH